MRESFSRVRPILAAFAVMAVSAPVLAQSSAAAEEQLRVELLYVEQLQALRLPDFAEIVIEQIKKRFPDAGPKIKVMEIQGLLNQGKFDDVQKVIAAIKDRTSPEYWALTLKMADYKFAFGRHDEAEALYKQFFKMNAKPSEALSSFYRDSAYNYAQMLLYLNRDADALKAYDLLDAVKLEEELARRVLAEKSELCIKIAEAEKDAKKREALLTSADKTADKLLWKQDLWYGKGVVFKAHVLMLRGKPQAADDLVEEYMPQLKLIHDALREQDDGSGALLRLSPMPECRYLMGAIKEKEAEGLVTAGGKADDAKILDLLLGAKDPATKKRKGNGAYNHFINVFARFPESQWAAECGRRAEKIRDLIKERYGKTIKSQVTKEQMAKVRQNQYAAAHLLFTQNQFKEAAAAYEDALNQFADCPEAVTALGNLAICYIEMQTSADVKPDDRDYYEIMADVVAAHLSERFCEREEYMRDAGDQLRVIGERYGEMKLASRRNAIYSMFFRDFPKHYAAGQLLASFAQREFEAQNYDAALNYYRIVAENYSTSQYYLGALSRIAQIYRELGATTNAIAALDNYVAALKKTDAPGQALPAAMFKSAEWMREYGSSFSRAADTNEEFTAEEKTAAIGKSTMWLARAIKGFGDVAKLLEKPASYQRNADEAKVNETIKEASLFTKALCLTLLQSDKPGAKAQFRTAAIKAFDDYVAAYPQGKYAPVALLRIGTLYTVSENMEEAQKALDRLVKEYPDSDEAKNSVPMLAAALIEMGLKGEGVARYRQMLATSGKYTLSQYLAAATALNGAREFDMAMQAYDKVLEGAKDDKALSDNAKLGFRAACLLGKAECLFGLKRYAEAHKAIDQYLLDKDLSRLQQYVEINMLLVKTASEEGRTERNDVVRTELFNTAVDAIKKVRAYKRPRNEQGQQLPPNAWTGAQRLEDARLRLESAEVTLRQLEAEKKLNLAERVEETRGKAIVAFEGMLMSLNSDDEALYPVIEKVFCDVIPLLIEHGKNADAVEDCERYLKLFPEGKSVTDVRTWLDQAKIGVK